MTAQLLEKSTPYEENRFVPYRQLDGGLNTLDAPSELDRNELAILQNAWYSYGKNLSKRPGSTQVATALPDGGMVTSMVSCRFASVTYVIVQSSHNNIYAAAVTAGSWPAAIGTVTGGTLRGAQMYDANTGKDTVFLVTGQDTPQMWQGPATSLVAVATGNPSAGKLPNKPGTGAASTNPITPAYVATLGNNSHLFYSGDPSAPSSVYVSDPFQPELFSTPAMQADPYGYTGSGGTFNPAIIGFNDGVDGGNITALQTLGYAMVVFKQSAIYVMFQTQLLGNVAWQVANVSPSRGALSPRSVVAFDQFICFLSIDGIYLTHGNPEENLANQKISANVPSYFDSSRFGQPALINNRANAVAVRYANRYIIWIDVGTGNPSVGVWLDFDRMVKNNMPAAGEIDGMTVSAAFQITGPQDDGHLIWSDPTASYVGHFGQGFTDPGGKPIAVFIAGKADLFEDQFGSQAPLMNKVPHRVDLIVAALSQTQQQQLQFQGIYNFDFSNSLQPTQQPGTLTVNPQAGLWGQLWGQFNWSSSALTESAYAIATLRPRGNAVGHILQIVITEQSVFPWLLLGYLIELNAREVAR